jgi:hypothetical protein
MTKSTHRNKSLKRTKTQGSRVWVALFRKRTDTFLSITDLQIYLKGPYFGKCSYYFPPSHKMFNSQILNVPSSACFSCALSSSQTNTGCQNYPQSQPCLCCWVTWKCDVFSSYYESGHHDHHLIPSQQAAQNISHSVSNFHHRY